MAKNAGKARKEFNDKFGKHHFKKIIKFYILSATVASFLMPEYEKNCLAEYANGSEDRMLFINPTDNSLNVLFTGIVRINSLAQFS